jgi:hypothetical protein
VPLEIDELLTMSYPGEVNNKAYKLMDGAIKVFTTVDFPYIILQATRNKLHYNFLCGGCLFHFKTFTCVVENFK